MYVTCSKGLGRQLWDVPVVSISGYVLQPLSVNKQTVTAFCVFCKHVLIQSVSGYSPEINIAFVILVHK